MKQTSFPPKLEEKLCDKQHFSQKRKSTMKCYFKNQNIKIVIVFLFYQEIYLLMKKKDIK